MTGNSGAGSATIFVCRTCPRYGPPPAGAARHGEALARRVQQLAADAPHAAGLTVLAVHCLGACRHPCNAAIAAPGTARLRFSQLDAADAEALLEAASGYFAGGDAVPHMATLPGSLQGRVTARPPPLRPAAGS